MKACWIDHGQDVIHERMAKHGVTEIVIPGEESPLANPAKVKELADRGYKVTVMFAWNWHGYGFRPPEEFARYCSERLKAIGHPAVNPDVLLDIEKGAGLNEFTYVTWVIRCLEQWRKLRPTRGTNLTLEGMQGGLFNGRAADVAKLLNMVGAIIPQGYTGDERLMDVDTNRLDLANNGFPHSRIRHFYLGKDVPLNFDGILWRQGLLPA